MPCSEVRLSISDKSPLVLFFPWLSDIDRLIDWLIAMFRGPVEQLRQESSSRVLSTALNRSRDIVQVTDSNNQVQNGKTKN